MIGEDHALLCDPVDIGGGTAHQTPVVRAHVEDTDVVAPDDQNIRLLWTWHSLLAFLSLRAGTDVHRVAAATLVAKVGWSKSSLGATRGTSRFRRSNALREATRRTWGLPTGDNAQRDGDPVEPPSQDPISLAKRMTSAANHR